MMFYVENPLMGLLSLQDHQQCHVITMTVHSEKQNKTKA